MADSDGGLLGLPGRYVRLRRYARGATSAAWSARNHHIRSRMAAIASPIPAASTRIKYVRLIPSDYPRLRFFLGTR